MSSLTDGTSAGTITADVNPNPQTYNAGNGALMTVDGKAIAAPVGAQQSGNGLWYSGGQAFSLAPVANSTPNYVGGGATLNANVTNPIIGGNNPPPVVVTSSSAAKDLQNKQAQTSQLTQDAQAQAAAKAAAATAKTNTGTTTGGEKKDDTPSLDKQINDIVSSLATDQAAVDTKAKEQTDPLQKQQQQEQEQLDQQGAYYLNQMAMISSGTYPLSSAEQALLSSTVAMYQRVIDAQQTANRGYTGQMTETMASLGISTSAPTQALGNIHAVIDAGNQKIADLDAKMSSAVANLTLAFQKQDYDMVSKAWEDTSKFLTDRTKTLQDMQDKITANAKDQKKELADREQLIYTQVLKPIQDTATEAAKYGAPKDVITAINNAKSPAEAITAAGQWLQDPTSTGGQYNAYVQATKAKGLTPMTPGDFIAKQKEKEAFATEAGKVGADQQNNPTPDSLTPDPAATGVTAAAGISLQAFNYLTQGTASMSRMPAAQRNQIMKEANDFLNKHGLDVSTFQSQYKAYNDVLQKNIQRANQTKIMSGEVAGSADALIAAIEAHGKDMRAVPGEESTTGMGSVRAGDILGLMAGKQVNSKFAQTYSFQIKAMANDLAGYFAAARGAAAPELQDQRDAADVISSGMNAGSTEAFKDAVLTNEEKVAGVVDKAANAAQKQVWDLFGVGAQYKPPAPQVNAKDSVDSYVKSNPNQAETVAKLYELPGWTDQDVMDYLNLKK